jgi:hypothetical protein
LIFILTLSESLKKIPDIFLVWSGARSQWGIPSFLRYRKCPRNGADWRKGYATQLCKNSPT